MSILENLMLGRTVGRGGIWTDRRSESREADRALSFVGLSHPPATLVRELSPGEKALVAIARSMGEGASLLFVDEATSTLPPAEAARVLAALADVVERGGTVVMVTHKLNEIMDSTGRIVMLIDGEIAADQNTANLDRAALVQLLAAHDQAGAASEERAQPAAFDGPPLVTAEAVAGGKLSGLSLDLYRGKVLGVTGIPGSGLYDLAYLVHGHMRPTSGRVTTPPGIKRGLVPPHRETQGGFNELSVQDNVGIGALRLWRRRERLIDARRERAESWKIIDRLAVNPRSLTAMFGTLSGGNKQKVVFGRIIASAPDVLILCEPTRGVDVKTRAALYQLILDLRDEGKAILVVTSDAEDLFAVCDQVSVIEDGHLEPFKSIKNLSTDDMEALL
jgi:ribose transport system ATP-binding protein